MSEPVYTDEQLEQFKADNQKGVIYNGRHYTTYEATQKQRQIERAIRTQKRRILAHEATGDKDSLLTSQIKYRRLNEEYTRFSKATKLRTQFERLEVGGFSYKQGNAAMKAASELEKKHEAEYNKKCEEVRKLIRSDELPKKLNIGNQKKHILTSNNYMPGRSYLTITLE